MDTEGLFNKMIVKGILQQAEFGDHRVPVTSLANFAAARSGTSLRRFFRYRATRLALKPH